MLQVLPAAALTGLQIGCVYAVIALGLSLIFGIIRVINFAHGSILMILMYLGFFLFSQWGIHPYLAILICAPAAFGFGYAIQHLLNRRLFIREKAYVVEPLGVLMLMAGFDMVLANLALLSFGPWVKTATGAASETIFRIGLFTISLSRLAIVPIVIILIFLVYWLLNRTELGNRIRSVGQNREAAAICGINVHHIYALTFGIGCAITAIGGCAMLPFYPIEPAMGLGLAIKAFIVVVLGGMGSIPGMLAAGIIIGLVESIVAQFVPATYGFIVALVIFLLVIFFRPRGLMGRIEV